MRVVISACTVLALCCGAARAADDEATVRESSERYTAGVLKQDAMVLKGLLHKEYHGHALLGSGSDQRMDAAGAVSHWTRADRRFTSLETTIERVQVVGNMAVETGKVSGTNAKNIYQGVTYTRVWVKDGTEWHLAHERY
jgi:hypothetical protein